MEYKSILKSMLSTKKEIPLSALLTAVFQTTNKEVIGKTLVL